MTIEFIRQGDDLNNWKESLLYDDDPESRARHSPEEEVNTIKASMEKRCPGGSQWKVIAQDDSSILFEWQSKPCPASDEHQIGRIIHGKHNWFALYRQGL